MVQDVLGQRILLENPSTYLGWNASTISEAEFLSELAERADCGLLLDVNNVHVSAVNLGFDSRAYLDAIPAHRVGQIHLAGFSDRGTHLFDTHSCAVSDEVWDLYRYALERIGSVASMVEWDDDIPPWPRLVEEVDRARQNHARVFSADGSPDRIHPVERNEGGREIPRPHATPAVHRTAQSRGADGRLPSGLAGGARASGLGRPG